MIKTLFDRILPQAISVDDIIPSDFPVGEDHTLIRPVPEDNEIPPDEQDCWGRVSRKENSGKEDYPYDDEGRKEQILP